MLAISLSSGDSPISNCSIVVVALLDLKFVVIERVVWSLRDQVWGHVGVNQRSRLKTRLTAVY
jgi:hypothetical protein